MQYRNAKDIFGYNLKECLHYIVSPPDLKCPVQYISLNSAEVRRLLLNVGWRFCENCGFRSSFSHFSYSGGQYEEEDGLLGLRELFTYSWA